MLQNATIVGMILGGIVLLLWFKPVAHTTEYTATTTATSTVAAPEQQYPEEWLEEAEAAKQAVIEKKKLEQRQAELETSIADLQAELDKVEKELGVYWRDPANVKRLIRETFPEEPDKALAIAMCESGLKPHAFNPHNRDGSTDGGLWQINSVHDARLKELGLDKYDPEDATTFARMLYDERGSFRDWVCYTKRMHVAYLR